MDKQTLTIKTLFGEKTVNIDEYEKKWVGEMARADFEKGLAKERGES